MYKSALQNFMTEIVNPLSDGAFRSAKDYFEANKDRLSDEFAGSFSSLLEKIEQKQKYNPAYRLGFIEYAMLRTSITDGSYKYRLTAYNTDWYYDNSDCCTYYDALWAFGCFDDMAQTLRREAKKYVSKIHDYHIDNIIQDEALRFNQLIVDLGRYTIPKFEHNDYLSDISMSDIVDVRIGEYFDITYSIYKFDKRKLDSDETKSLLEEKTTTHYGSFKNLNLAEGSYPEADFCFCDFSGSDFANSNFANSNLIGTSWRNCNLESTDFSYCDLSGADFRGASMETTHFKMAKLPNTIW